MVECPWAYSGIFISLNLLNQTHQQVIRLRSYPLRVKLLLSLAPDVIIGIDERMQELRERGVELRREDRHSCFPTSVRL